MMKRLDPLKKCGIKPLLHKTEDARSSASKVKALPRVRDTPDYEIQLKIAKERCLNNGDDCNDRGVLLSHVNSWLCYYDGGRSGLDGHHDLYWFAQNDPGFMALHCYETLSRGGSKKGLSGFKTLITVSVDSEKLKASKRCSPNSLDLIDIISNYVICLLNVLE